jgi:hypothetical protein
VNIQSECGALEKGPGDQIVFFHLCWLLSLEALIGLVAQEIAHCFSRSRDSSEVEKKGNALAGDWGFGRELGQYQREKSVLATRYRS